MSAKSGDNHRRKVSKKAKGKYVPLDCEALMRELKKENGQKGKPVKNSARYRIGKR